jgi:hypothetical protein
MLRDISTISRYRTTLESETKRGTGVSVELVRYNNAILQHASWKAWPLEHQRSIVATVPLLYLKKDTAFASDGAIP